VFSTLFGRYQLMHTVRSHIGSKDQAYECVFQQEDNEGYTGVKLDKTLMTVAGEALKKNIEVLGSVVLPLSEQIKYVPSTHTHSLSLSLSSKK